MKEIRLNNFVSKRASKFLLHWYKEAKKTHDIETILAFKSFVKRMIDAQDEYETNGRKVWTDIDNYIITVLDNEKYLHCFRYTDTLGFIVSNTNNAASAFNYRKRIDLLKLL